MDCCVHTFFAPSLALNDEITLSCASLPSRVLLCWGLAGPRCLWWSGRDVGGLVSRAGGDALLE